MRFQILLALSILLTAIFAFSWPSSKNNETISYPALRGGQKMVRVIDKGPKFPTADNDIPDRYERLYKKAGSKYSLDWRILAAIGKNESDHGRDQTEGIHYGINYADCCAGPMQFSIKEGADTWSIYATDGDKNGIIDVYSPADSIFSMGKMILALKEDFGTTELVMAAYNAGPGAVSKYGGVPPYSETQNYVANGISYIKSFKRSS